MPKRQKHTKNIHADAHTYSKHVQDVRIITPPAFQPKNWSLTLQRTAIGLCVLTAWAGYWYAHSRGWDLIVYKIVERYFR